MENSLQKFPGLIFLDKTLEALVADFDDGVTMIIADLPQKERLVNLKNLVIVDSNCVSHVTAIGQQQHFKRYVGIGACAALDVARACAKSAGAALILVPTFLSTSCISVDRSVLKYDGKYRSTVTSAPEKVIILDEFIEISAKPSFVRAARAGYGDFFAGLSAAADFCRLNNCLVLNKFADLAGFYLSGLDWVLTRFKGFDRRSMRRLARYSHISSLMVIQRGDTALSAGGEHRLYYTIMENHLFDREKMPFHGELVAAGTLMTLWSLKHHHGFVGLYEKFRDAMTRLGLPVDRRGLEDIGLQTTHLARALALMANENNLISEQTRLLSPEDFVRKVFDEQ